MPPTVGFRSDLTQVLGNYRPEFENPPTDRFIADHQSALSQKILDIPVAQGEPKVEPDSAEIGDGRASVFGRVLLVNVSMPPRGFRSGTLGLFADVQSSGRLCSSAAALLSNSTARAFSEATTGSLLRVPI